MKNEVNVSAALEDEMEVIESVEVQELEQRFEYDNNITICHYEWHN